MTNANSGAQEAPAPATGVEARPAGVRTPADYAIEHAEYMAVAGDHLLAAIEALSAAELHREETDEDDGAVHDARDAVWERVRRLRTGIYQFRKRRDRALASRLAGAPVVNEPVATEPMIWCAFGRLEERWMALPEYASVSELATGEKVLESARNESFNGTLAERLRDLDWRIRPLAPLYASPVVPAQQPEPLTDEQIIEVAAGLASLSLNATRVHELGPRGKTTTMFSEKGLIEFARALLAAQHSASRSGSDPEGNT